MRSRSWPRRIEALHGAVHRLSGTCWPGRTCPGPRFVIRLVWDGEERLPPIDEPCPVCGRTLAELGWIEQRRALRQLRIDWDT